VTLFGPTDVYGFLRGQCLNATFLATFCKEPVPSRLQPNRTKTDLQELGHHRVICLRYSALLNDGLEPCVYTKVEEFLKHLKSYEILKFSTA